METAASGGGDSVVPMILIGGTILLPLIWLLRTWNQLIRLGNLIRESWSNVDVVLKRRYELIPNLVETVKGYAKHEREVLELVVRAREQAVASHGRAGSQAQDENRLVRSVNQLLARAEAYPDLKASEQFLALQRELVDTEDRIAAARRFYNANVREHNNLVEQFPSRVVAGMIGRETEDFFEVEDLAIRRAPVAAF